MIELLWPWVLVLLSVPIVCYFAFTPLPSNEGALEVPRLGDFQFSTGHEIGNTRTSWVRVIVLWLAWSLVVIALARPQFVGPPEVLPTTGRDLMLAVDISGSMSNGQMFLDGEQVTRLEAVKQVVSEFIASRDGDRVGLILFGSSPYIYAPLTFDVSTVDKLMQEAPGGIAGGQTAIGDTIGLAVKRLRERPEDHRILILLTDGSHNAGSLSPNEAAKLATEMGVRIYTIGIGGSRITNDFDSLFQLRLPSSMSRNLDETVLKEVAELTAGKFFLANDVDELKAVYEEINELEPLEQETRAFRPIKALFYWPLGIAGLLFLCLWLTSGKSNHV